ncbi:hypothetical protein ACLOJK_024691 [Asimina triloba]
MGYGTSLRIIAETHTRIPTTAAAAEKPFLLQMVPEKRPMNIILLRRQIPPATLLSARVNEKKSLICLIVILVMSLSLPLSNPSARRSFAFIGRPRSLHPLFSPHLGLQSPRLTPPTVLCCSFEMASSAKGEAFISPQSKIAHESSAVAAPPSTLPKDSLSFSRAYWVSRPLIAWNVDDGDASFCLYASKSAQLFLADNGIQGENVQLLFLVPYLCFPHLYHDIYKETYRESSTRAQTNLWDIRSIYRGRDER